MEPISDPGLVLKITPPKLRKSLLARERLRCVPTRGEDAAVYFVEAPAGHGKTSLLAQWRLDWLQAGTVVAWFSLDADDTPIRVVSGIGLALRRATGSAAFASEVIEAVRRGAETAQALTSLLAEITEAATPTVLIFDNFERVSDPLVLEIFDYLLHNLPPNLQLAAGSRAPPPLRTADLLAHGTLRRITADELRFDLAETIRLLTDRLGNRVDADLCGRLHEITEGWPLGLQLAAAALERSTDPARAIQAFATSRDDATRQLFDGMVDALPAALAEFVTRCALLDALHPSLCEAITANEDAALSLQRLVVETPLLTAAEEGEWLRLHPLAREYLRKRADDTMSEAQRRDLHVRAWEWLAGRGFPEQAAQHALAAGFRDEALALVAGSLIDQFEQGDAAVTVEWLARLLPEEIQGNGSLRMIALWMQVLGYESRDAPPDAIALADDPSVDASIRQEAIIALAASFAFADGLDTCRQQTSRFSATATDSRALRVHANLNTFLDIHAGATEAARQHQAKNPDDSRFPVTRIWGDYFMGLSYLWEGRPVLAEQVARLQHARWEARVGRRGAWTSLLASVLATACWQRDSREEARTLLAHRLDVIEQRTGLDGILCAYRTLAQIAAADSDEARAFAYLEALAAMGASRNLPRLVVVSFSERVRLHAAGRRPEQAGSLLGELDAISNEHVFCSMLTPLVQLERALAHAYVGLAKGDLDGVGVHLESALTFARKINRGYEIVQILAMQALLAERTGKSAGPLLIEALSRAEAGGLIRVFADTLPDVVDLVRRVSLTDPRLPVTRAFIDQVLAAASISAAEAKPQSAHSTGSTLLTPKEGEVLHLLAGGLPNKRIATELGLSGETVKWHMKKLFAKLNAGSREHAVDRARMLGLLP